MIGLGTEHLPTDRNNMDAVLDLAVSEGWAQESIKRIQKYQHDGKVGFIGLSNHNVDIARKAVESGLIDVLMFPVNIYGHYGDPARKELLEICIDKGVGVVAMKPYHGGRLLRNNGHPTGITPIQCLHFVLAQPVETTVPGPRNPAEMREALQYIQASDEDKIFISLHEELKSKLKGQCLNCRHCLPCPQEIDIPFVILNLDYVQFFSGSYQSAQFHRELYASQPVKASECTQCGVCLERCSFDVDIIGKMYTAVEVFESSE